MKYEDINVRERAMVAALKLVGWSSTMEEDKAKALIDALNKKGVKTEVNHLVYSTDPD